MTDAGSTAGVRAGRVRRDTTAPCTAHIVRARRGAAPPSRRARGSALILGFGIAGFGIALAMAPSVAARAAGAPHPLALATLLGGSMEDSVRDIAAAEDGYFYLTGGTASDDLPATPGAFDTTFDPRDDGGAFGAHDVWVAKVGYDGRVVWCTYVGGPGYDRAYAIEADESGVYVAGRAGIGFPVTTGALQTGFGGDDLGGGAYGPQDGFVLKLSRDGRMLLWSTYFGDPGGGFVRDLAIDRDGDVYVAQTAVRGPSPHVTPGAWRTEPPPGSGGVVAKIAGDGSSVLWGTYLGGSGDDLINPSIRVDFHERVFVAGESRSSDFPTTPGAFQPASGGGSDMTLTGLAPDGGSAVFSTYFGGSGREETETHGLAIGSGGVLVLAAITDSDDLPGTAAAFQPEKRDGLDGFVARFASTGALLQATYLGGDGNDGVEGVAVSALGEVVVSGFTTSTDFPLAGLPAQETNAGGVDLFVATLSAGLEALVDGTYLGGGKGDSGRSAAVGRDGALLVGGHTRSGDFPSTDGSVHRSPGTGYDARDGAAVVLVPEPSGLLQQVAGLAAFCVLGRWARGPQATGSRQRRRSAASSSSRERAASRGAEGIGNSTRVMPASSQRTTVSASGGQK